MTQKPRVYYDEITIRDMDPEAIEAIQELEDLGLLRVTCRRHFTCIDGTREDESDYVASVRETILANCGPDSSVSIRELVAMCEREALWIDRRQIRKMAEAGHLCREGNRVWVPSDKATARARPTTARR